MLTKSLRKTESPILVANGRRVRHDGKTFFIRSQTMGRFVLADAEQIIPPAPQGTKPINLFERVKLAKELRAKVEARLFS